MMKLLKLMEAVLKIAMVQRKLMLKLVGGNVETTKHNGETSYSN